MERSDERINEKLYRTQKKGDTMRIATFNIWNSDRGMPWRVQQVIGEIKKVDADVICLQEVKEDIYEKIKNEVSGYGYDYYHTLDDEYDGLLIMSKYPISTKRYTRCAILTTIKYEDDSYLVANLHLPSDDIILKERYIVDILKEINTMATDHAILTGDFNCLDNSSVHHYLTGQRSLLNSEAKPCWYDLAEVYADITGTASENTLDLRNNPRWGGKNYTYTSSRLDRIYVRDAFPKTPPLLRAFSLFGKEIDERSGYCASDHYGVVAEITVS